VSTPPSGRDPTDPEAEVLPLGVSAPDPNPPSPPRRPAGLHGIAIAGVALFATVFLFALIAFFTIGWTEATRRVVIAVLMGSAIGTLACLSTAVLSAARDVYGRRSDDR